MRTILFLLALIACAHAEQRLFVLITPDDVKAYLGSRIPVAPSADALGPSADALGMNRPYFAGPRPDDSPRLKTTPETPKIIIESPSRDQVVQGSFDLKVKFSSPNNTQIDPYNFAIKYGPTDITERVRTKEFVKSDGFEISNVVVPPGNHSIKIYVMDRDRRIGETTLELKVKE